MGMQACTDHGQGCRLLLQTDFIRGNKNVANFAELFLFESAERLVAHTLRILAFRIHDVLHARLGRDPTEI